MKTLYINGKVYTGDFTLANAFAVSEDRFTFVGDGATQNPEDYDLVVDLEGKFVSPGFNDSHMHLLNYGQSLTFAPLAQHTDSLEDLISCMKEYAKENSHSPGRWLIGRGWNQDYFRDVERMPSREDLDLVSTEVPVVIVRCCGHCLVANSKAMEVCGITPDTPSPSGGRIGKEEGKLDGRFFDDAMELIYEKQPAPELDALMEMIKAGARELNSFGITSCQSDDYCVFTNVPRSLVDQAFLRLEEQGELTVRVYEQCNFTNTRDLKEFIDEGNVTGKGSDFFKYGPLKLLGDGSLGARTALLSRPYADDPTTSGLLLIPRDILREMIFLANKSNMQIAIHTIGDACLDLVLDAYEDARKDYPENKGRHGIVHCQITRPDQLKRIAELGLVVYAQSIFLDYDIHIVEDRVGKDLASSSYSWKTLMEQGVSVSNGSDCPVETPGVMAGIQCAVTRKTLAEDTPPYLSKEAFTVKEALDSYTIKGAYASFEEKNKGLIAPGYLADFVLLSDNPLDVEPSKLKDIQALGTYLGGKLIYDKSLSE